LRRDGGREAPGALNQQAMTDESAEIDTVVLDNSKTMPITQADITQAPRNLVRGDAQATDSPPTAGWHVLPWRDWWHALRADSRPFTTTPSLEPT